RLHGIFFEPSAPGSARLLLAAPPGSHVVVVGHWDDRRMGSNNRDRRRQKKRRQVAAERARERRRADAGAMPGRGRGIGADDVERVLTTAVCAQREHDETAVYELSEMLAEGPPGPGGCALVDAVVARCAWLDIAAAGERGWDPDALSRFVGRRLGTRHGRVLAVLDDAPGGAVVDQLASRLRID